MLEILNGKAQKENIGNIKTIEEDLSKITIDNVGKHDIVVASRSLNGILNIKETIANINDNMWSELFLSNKDALLKEMDKYRKTFDKLYNCIRDNDREEMRSMMRISSERRAQFNKVDE